MIPAFNNEGNLPAGIHWAEWDRCWDTEGMDIRRLARLDPILVRVRGNRAAQKAKYGGEIFPVNVSNNKVEVLDLFQHDKITGRPKGIIGFKLDREAEPASTETSV